MTENPFNSSSSSGLRLLYRSLMSPSDAKTVAQTAGARKPETWNSVVTRLQRQSHVERSAAAVVATSTPPCFSVAAHHHYLGGYKFSISATSPSLEPQETNGRHDTRPSPSPRRRHVAPRNRRYDAGQIRALRNLPDKHRACLADLHSEQCVLDRHSGLARPADRVQGEKRQAPGDAAIEGGQCHVHVRSRPSSDDSDAGARLSWWHGPQGSMRTLYQRRVYSPVPRLQVGDIPCDNALSASSGCSETSRSQLNRAHRDARPFYCETWIARSPAASGQIFLVDLTGSQALSSVLFGSRDLHGSQACRQLVARDKVS